MKCIFSSSHCNFHPIHDYVRVRGRAVYTEHDHERTRDHESERDNEREHGVRVGLRISDLYESVYTKATTNEAGNWFLWKVEGLPKERTFRRWLHELILAGQSVCLFSWNSAQVSRD